MQVANPPNTPPRYLLIIVSSAVSTIVGLSLELGLDNFFIGNRTQNMLRTAFVIVVLSGLSAKPSCLLTMARVTKEART